MKQIRTVLTDLAPSPLFSHCHEHIWISREELGDRCPVTSIDDVAASLAELKAFYEAGGCLLADAQPTMAGGSPTKLGELSRDSGVAIIASTGFHKLCFYRDDSPIHTLTEDELVASFCRDIRENRCGMIKVAADSIWLDGRYETLHRAAAKAAVLTGAPVICHVEKGADPVEVLDFYTGLGVAPASMILCHCDRAVADFSRHLTVVERGAYLEYDTVARPKYHDDEAEIELISQLVKAGYGSRVLLGLDTTRERLIAYGSKGPGLSYIKNTFVPMLLAAGIDGETVRLMTEVNPAEAFSFLLK